MWMVRKDAMESTQLDKSTCQPKACDLLVEEHRGTYFYDTEGNRLGSEIGIVPVTFYQGMTVTINDHDCSYRVVGWNYHLGYKHEEAGLRVILEPITEY